MLAAFVKANFAVSKAITPSGLWGAKAQHVFRDWAEELLSFHPALVLDVGAGRKWNFSVRPSGTEIIGLDIDGDEMRLNPVLDLAIVGDACRPFSVTDVDLIIARAVVEHLTDTSAFCRNAYEALKPGGVLVATFPNKWATFAIINRCLPVSASRWLLSKLYLNASGTLGFRAHYDCCTPSSFKKALTDAGFSVEREYASYVSSIYFAGIVPAYLVSLAVDGIRHATGQKALSSHLTYMARKPKL